MMNFKFKYRQALKKLIVNIENLKKYEQADKVRTQLLLCVGAENYCLSRKLIDNALKNATKDFCYILSLEELILNLNDIEDLVMYENIRRLTEE